jgi:hypothetical protein
MKENSDRLIKLITSRKLILSLLLLKLRSAERNLKRKKESKSTPEKERLLINLEKTKKNKSFLRSK